MKKSLLPFLLLSGALLLSTTCAAQHCCSKAGHHLMGMTKTASATRSDSLDVQHTHLYLDMTNTESQQISGIANVQLRTLVDEIEAIDFDLQTLTVDSVFIDEQMVTFDMSSPLLRIFPLSVLSIDTELDVQIHYHGSPDGDPSGWGGFYFQGDYAFNLGVGFDSNPHNYGRTWFPCFDNFVERCTFSFEVLTDNGDTAYCNGERISELQVGEDSLMTRWEMNAPIPSYLTNIAVAPYSHFESSFTSTTGEEIPIWLTAQASDLNNVVNSFDNLNNCLDAFESDFGPYRWNRVGYVFVPFGSGAMEHATNIAYPLSLAQGDLTYETLMAHELAHHWWGDLVTCDTQEEMWINEGMASYCESIFLEQVYGDEAYWESVHENHKDVLLYAHIQDGERLPVSGIGHEFTYGDHVYNKGAVIAHNLRQVMGDEDFFEASQSFLEANTYQDVNSIQMRDFFQDFTEMNLTDFFDGWIFQPGFPDYRINNWNSTEVSEGEFLTAISIQQFAHYTNSPLNSAPLEVTLLGNDGEHLDSQILVLDQLTDVNIESTFEPEFVILNRGDELLQAQLSEERIITDAGIETFSRSEFRLNIDELGTDSLWFRVENHWAEATINDGSNGLFISNDRFWRVYSNFPESFNAEARIRFYGNPNSANYFDPKFFAFVEELDLNELNLVLVHRPFNSVGWTEVPFELNAQGDEENFQGMINFPLSENGDYAWAIATDQLNVEENELSTLQVFPNPGSTFIQVKLNAKAGYTILSLAGKTIETSFTSEVIDISHLASGMYILVLDNGQRATFIKE